MKHTTFLFAIGAGLLGIGAGLNAQIALENFSAFESPQTLFYGDWSASGDPFTGNAAPAASFSQGAGIYTIAGVTNADTSYVERTFAGPVDLGLNHQLELSLRLNNGNTAQSFTVFLLDSQANAASATFEASGFNTLAFLSQTLALTADASFAWDDVTAFRISGNDPFAGGFVDASFDLLRASAVASPVPEASTYTLCGIVLLGGVAIWRRWRGATPLGGV